MKRALSIMALLTTGCSSADAQAVSKYERAMQCAMITGGAAALIGNLPRNEFEQLADIFDAYKTKADLYGQRIGKAPREVARDREEFARSYLEAIASDQTTAPKALMARHREDARRCLADFPAV